MRVRELDLAARAALRLLELVEDLGREHVAADDGEGGRRRPRLGLLDDVGHPVEAGVLPVLRGGRPDDPVARRLGLGDLADRDDRAVGLLVDVDQLADRRPVGDDDIVREEHRERLVADQVLGHEDRVAEAQLLLLPDVGDLGEVADVADLAELLDLPLLLEEALELERQVEVILDRPLLAGGDDDHLLDAGGDRLFDRVLDDRLVDEGQHLLGLCLRRGQEPGAPAGRREHRFSDAHGTPWGGGWAGPRIPPSPRPEPLRACRRSGRQALDEPADGRRERVRPVERGVVGGPAEDPAPDVRDAPQERPLAEPEDQVEVAVDDEDRASVGEQAVAKPHRQERADGGRPTARPVAAGDERFGDLGRVAAAGRPSGSRHRPAAAGARRAPRRRGGRPPPHARSAPPWIRPGRARAPATARATPRRSRRTRRARGPRRRPGRRPRRRSRPPRRRRRRPA